MTWARLDDGFHDHPKTVAAWKRSPGAIGLHARAIAWVARQEKDGHVPLEVVEMFLPDDKERSAMVSVLVETGIWHTNGSGYLIHDYLDYNPSRKELTEKRRKDRERKRGNP